MSKITNIHEYKKLRKITKELPDVLVILDKFQKDLYDYMHYRDVGFINNSINDAKNNIESSLVFCKKRLEKDFNK